MALDKYEVFVRVAETCNLTKAAEMLNYTQSAISHIIKNFEDELGLQLIVREKSGIRLTSAGERLLHDAKMVVKHEASISQTAAMLNGAEIGVISVGSFSSTSIRWMPRIIRNMQSKSRRIEVHQTHSTYDALEQMIASGKVDCGFTTSRCNENFYFVPLMKDEYKIVLPKEHYLSRYERIPIEALRDEQFIMLHEGNKKYDTSVLLAEIDINVQHTVEDDFVAIPLVESGLGITVLPQLFLDCVNTNAVIKSFAVPRYRTLGIATKSKDTITPLTDLFISFAMDCATEYAEFRKQHVKANDFNVI